MKKEYLEPIIEIEYYDDVILCIDGNNSEASGAYGNAGDNSSNIELPPWMQ